MKTIPINPKPMTITAESGNIGGAEPKAPRPTAEPLQLTLAEMREHSANLWRVVHETQRQYLIDAILNRSV